MKLAIAKKAESGHRILVYFLVYRPFMSYSFPLSPFSFFSK
jgi:hypothetical protein